MAEPPPPRPTPEERRHARRTSLETCLNCGTPIQGRYCHHCGQEGVDYRVSFRIFMRDVLDAFTLNSKFFRSIRPLLLKPGFLTTQYTKGHRGNYILPLRLYLFTSFLFFFLFTFILEPQIASLSDSASSGSAAVAVDTLSQAETERRAEAQREAVQEGLAQMDNQLRNIPGMPAEAQEAVAQAMEQAQVQTDSAFTQADSMQTDTTTTDTTTAVEKSDSFWKNAFAKFNDNNTDDENERLVLLQDILLNALDSAPQMIFLMLPLFVLILKLLYIRSKRLYLEHLVFAFHIHAFLFILLSFFILISFFGWWLLLVLPPIYIIWAMRRVYQQGWIKTLLKAWIAAWCYLWLLVWAGVGLFLFSTAFLEFQTGDYTFWDLFS